MSLLSQTSHGAARRARAAAVRARRALHTAALARDLPASFADAVVAHAAAPSGDVSLPRARRQHAAYLAHLRRHVPTLCLPPLAAHPDCAFVEDAVVALGGVAVVARMGHASRRGEAASVGDALRQLGVARVLDMGAGRDDDSGGERPACDGGDVLYTGRHLFVGLSGRTNGAGFRFLRDAFAGRDVVAVPPVVAGRDVLHLKSAVTHLDARTLLAPEGPLGDAVLDAMGAAERGYVAVRLPDVLACNAVVVNGHVLAQDAPCEASKGRIERACQERGLGLTFVDTSELARKDAALTCCSVLLSV